MNRRTKLKIAVGLTIGAVFGGAIAANAQSLPFAHWSNINPGSISHQSWTSNGQSRVTFKNCGLVGANLSIPDRTWNVRHPGLFGATAYAGERQARCSRFSSSTATWDIGNFVGNQLTLAGPSGTIETDWNVVDVR